MRKLKVMTILGTRPEIIRLSSIIKKLDQFCDHKLVHTGQNYDYELNEIFFEDLQIRKPSFFSKRLEKRAQRQLERLLSKLMKCSEKKCQSVFWCWGTRIVAWQ